MLTMDISLHQSKCISSPFRSSSHRPLSVRPRVLITVPRNPRNFISFRPRNMCSASISDTLVAGKSGEVLSMKEDDEFGDLKSWMHKNGLPPCKVVLLERPSHDNKLRPIHYVAASEDLQVRSDLLCYWILLIDFVNWRFCVSLYTYILFQAGDIAVSVPNSLVVTLERVLGNETIGK